MAQANSMVQQRSGQKPKLGRPKKKIDLDLVQKLALLQCTHSEIASTLNISVDTLTRNKHFAEVYKRGSESGRKSLRRFQFENAAKGNATMQIWLGKQYLGQVDELRHQVNGGQPHVLVLVQHPSSVSAANQLEEEEPVTIDVAACLS